MGSISARSRFIRSKRADRDHSEAYVRKDDLHPAYFHQLAGGVWSQGEREPLQNPAAYLVHRPPGRHRTRELKTGFLPGVYSFERLSSQEPSINRNSLYSGSLYSRSGGRALGSAQIYFFSSAICFSISFSVRSL